VVVRFVASFIEFVLFIAFAQANKGGTWDWIHRKQMLNKSEKQLSSRCACPAIKPEGEFAQIVGQTASPDSALVCAEKPSFKQGCDEMRQRQVFGIFTYLMSITFFEAVFLGRKP
jgi:hypothetical protein